MKTGRATPISYSLESELEDAHRKEEKTAGAFQHGLFDHAFDWLSTFEKSTFNIPRIFRGKYKLMVPTVTWNQDHLKK
jgi:hypothetical protein